MEELVRLGTLPKGATFIIPGYTDALPSEPPYAGRHYKYRVTKDMGNGTMKVYNKDLRMYIIFSNNLKVILT